MTKIIPSRHKEPTDPVWYAKVVTLLRERKPEIDAHLKSRPDLEAWLANPSTPSPNFNWEKFLGN